MLTLPNGAPAADNAALVRAARDSMADGLRQYTSEEIDEFLRADELEGESLKIAKRIMASFQASSDE